MNNLKKSNWVIAGIFVCSSFPPQALLAQAESDTLQVSTTKEEKNRNVMLNASDASKPREVSIGLPSSVGGTDIFEDGLPVVYYFWPHMAHTHWRGGAAYSHNSLMKLSETALTSGSVGYAINSFTRLGKDTFKGELDYTANHFGMQKIDMNIVGPIKKGWSYTGSIFQNFDPGSNDLKYTQYHDRTQIYKFGLTKRWNDGKGVASVLYKYSQAKLPTDNNGPFFYTGDGSVESLDGFRLGHDSYMPADGKFQYMDVRTGNIVTTNFRDMSSNEAHDALFKLTYDFDNGMHFNFNMKYSHADVNINNNILSGIDDVTAEKGYTYADGTAYTGKVQNRYILLYNGRVNDLMATAELTRRSGRHDWRIGLNQWYNHTNLGVSSSNMAHEVKANPERLAYNGKEFWGMNTGSEYYAGQENKLALYFSDDWNITRRLNLYYGLRLEYYRISGDACFNPTTQDTYNNRTENFNLNQAGVKKMPFSHHWINPIATLNANYRIAGGFGLTGDYLFNRQRPRLENFAGQDSPALNPVDVHLGRFGIYYNNDWIKLVSTVSYIRKTNYKSRVQFTRTVNDVSETQTKAVMYDIATMGWTTDAVVTPFKGFSCHLLFTLQKPQYKNFKTDLTFSDGSTQTYDFSDKTVTEVSQTLAEIDPAYQFGDWRFWLSFRYFGRQYANKPNSLYFNGRWETFGGIDYKVNKHLALNVNVINFLNQSGAQGSISAADLVEDASGYKNYLMSGSFIRPFTMEFGVKITL